MRFALIHLLAVDSLSEQDIHQKTRIPKSQLPSLLAKIADKQGSRWELTNKSYKELDPWSFRYSADQRQTAIDHAIRAFDRARIPKDDKVWQMLLQKEDRNKGTILSRLHLTAERKDPIGTPGLTPTPIHLSAATTPKLGSTGTPRSSAATGRSAGEFSIEKRLKEAKKKGAMEKKKQEREVKEAAAVASDRESKPRIPSKKPIPPKKVSSKVKSDEVVHSSDEEEEGEVKESPKLNASDLPRKEPPKPSTKSRPAAAERRESSASEAPSLSREVKPRSKPSTASTLSTHSAERKDSAVSKSKVDTGVSPRPTSLPKKPETALAAKSGTKTKDGSFQKSTQASSATQRPQISPRRLTDTKPKVPSPLGTSPPRNASDHTEKSTKTTVKSASATNTSKTAKSSTTIKSSEPLSFFGEGIKTGSNSRIITKKRPLESDPDSSESAKKAVKSSNATPAKMSNGPSATKSTSSKSSTNVSQPARSVANTDKNLKRKANDLSSGLHDHGAAPSSKHRKTDSGSTHSQAPTNSSVASLTTAPTVSPDPSSPARSDFSDNNLADILNDEYEGGPLTWEQTRAAAETFRSKLYPEYLKLYRRLEQTPSEKVPKEDTVRLWQLHNRLEAVKRRIEVACRNGHNLDI